MFSSLVVLMLSQSRKAVRKSSRVLMFTKVSGTVSGSLEIVLTFLVDDSSLQLTLESMD